MQMNGKEYHANFKITVRAGAIQGYCSLSSSRHPELRQRSARFLQRASRSEGPLVFLEESTVSDFTPVWPIEAHSPTHVGRKGIFMCYATSCCFSWLRLQARAIVTVAARSWSVRIGLSDVARG